MKSYQKGVNARKIHFFGRLIQFNIPEMFLSLSPNKCEIIFFFKQKTPNFMKKILSLLAVLLACASAQAQSWLSEVPEPEAYNDYTVVFAQLTTTNITSTDLVIGAFIDGKCRVSVSPDVDVSGAPVTTISGNPLYTIKVPGNLRTTINDSGKTISFKVYDPGTGLEYPLTNTVTFDGSTYGDPPSESALFFTLVAPTAYNLTLTEVEVGTEYTLTDYLSVDAGAVLPDNVTWSLSAGDPTAVVDLSNIVTITEGKRSEEHTSELQSR